MATTRERHHITSQIVAPTIRVYEQNAASFLARWVSRRKQPPALLLDFFDHLPNEWRFSIWVAVEGKMRASSLRKGFGWSAWI